MNTKEAIEWLRGLKFSVGDSFVTEKREALEKGIKALETLEKLENWLEVQVND